MEAPPLENATVTPYPPWKLLRTQQVGRESGSVSMAIQTNPPVYLLMDTATLTHTEGGGEEDTAPLIRAASEPEAEHTLS